MSAFAVKEFLDGFGLNGPAKVIDYIVHSGFMQEHAPALIQQMKDMGVPLDDIIQRVGNNVIWTYPDGSTQVLAVLEQASGHLGGLSDQMSGLGAGMSSLADGQAAIGMSLAGLGKLSMVTLGFSALTSVVATLQFAYLRRRLNALQKDIRKLEIKIESQTESELEASIDFLKHADDTDGEKQERYFHDSLVSSRNVRGYFRNLVNNRDITNDDIRVKQYYARKYFLALSIELSSLLGLREPDQFKKRLEEDKATLQTIARMFFNDVLAGQFEKYLSQNFADICTLEQMTSIARDAARFGCQPSNMQLTPAGLFEQRRAWLGGKLTDMRFGFSTFKQKASEDLAILTGIFEEIKRLLSWLDTTAYYEAHGTNVIAISERVKSTKQFFTTQRDGKVALFSYSIE